MALSVCVNKSLRSHRSVRSQGQSHHHVFPSGRVWLCGTGTRWHSVTRAFPSIETRVCRDHDSCGSVPPATRFCDPPSNQNEVFTYHSLPAEEMATWHYGTHDTLSNQEHACHIPLYCRGRSTIVTPSLSAIRASVTPGHLSAARER